MQFIQLMLSGITMGMLYALVGLGFVIIYKSTKVFNFAQGELVIVGTYFAIYLISYMKIPVLVAIVLAILFAVIVGFGIERIFLRSMIGQPLISVIMVTIGLSSVLKAATGLIWGLDDMPFVPFFSSEPIIMGNFIVSEVQLWITLITVISLSCFIFFYQKSKYGLAMRCSASNQDWALLMGVSVKRVFGASWALACVVATIGGVFMANLITVNFSLGFFALKAFPAAVLGGMDSIKGVIVGGLVIGIAESLAGGYIDPLLGGGTKDTIAFLLLLLILVVRPYGFFGTEEIERV